jgi:drug/metabolite transporter (DMT)-like permease
MSSPVTKLPGATDYAILTVLGIIWGASFTFIKIAVTTVPAIPMTISRLTLTAMIMLALMAGLRERLPTWGRIWWFIGASALLGNALPFLLVAWGEEGVDGALAAILMSPSPLFAAVLAHLLTSDDKLNRYKLAGVGLGVAGVAVLMGIDNLFRLGADAKHQLVILAAGCCYGANVVINRWLTGGSPVANVTAVIVVSVLLLTPLLLLPGLWTFTPSTASLTAIVTLAVLSTAIGTLIMVTLVKRQGAAFTAQVNFLVPVFGVISGALLLSERPSARAVAGLALILTGVAIARRGAGLRPTLSNAPTTPARLDPP